MRGVSNRGRFNFTPGGKEMNYLGLENLIKRALEEDIGHGDITTANLIPREQQAAGIFYAKSPGIVAGIDVCRAVFNYLDPDIGFEVKRGDGDLIEPGDTIAVVSGRAASILTGERVALNFLQRLSGIASKTRAMAESIKYYKAELVDTRKTTPGLRVLEKYAVKIGGARNHRFGLYDGVMIKDNHIKIIGSIQKAVSTIRSRIPHTVKIELEVETLEQLQEALDSRVDIILLDNMDIEKMKRAVDIANGRALLEASGGINEDNIVEVAKTGVDFISVGALTHSVKSLDISLEICK